jgi:hypothetical protein
MIDVYESAIDDLGRYGAVFERDDEAAYFYLLDLRRERGAQIVSTFNAETIAKLPANTLVSIKWCSPVTAVGLFIGGSLSAIFDLRAASPEGRWADSEDACLFKTH